MPDEHRDAPVRPLADLRPGLGGWHTMSRAAAAAAQLQKALTPTPPTPRRVYKYKPVTNMPSSLAEPSAGTGTCTECGDLVLVRADGSALWHRDLGAGRSPDRGERQPCRGTGFPVVEVAR